MAQIIVVQGADEAAQVPGLGAIANDVELRFARDAQQLARALIGPA